MFFGGGFQPRYLLEEVMIKITEIKFWFMQSKVNKNGEFKGSSYRLLKRDMLNIANRLEYIFQQDLKKWHFDAQRRRVKLMLLALENIDKAMNDLLFAGSEHNCFYVRQRSEKLKEFLLKYSILLDTYNNKFLERIHGAIEFSQYNGMVIKDNLIIKEGDQIEIIK